MENYIDCEPVRKISSIELVSIDISDPDVDVSFLASKIKNLKSVFNKKYENLVMETVDDISSGKKFLILRGIRKETDDEFRSRMNLSEDTSWTLKYQKISGCSYEEAKEQMIKMYKNGKPLTPEEWKNFLQSQVEDFLNMRNINNS